MKNKTILVISLLTLLGGTLCGLLSSPEVDDLLYELRRKEVKIDNSLYVDLYALRKERLRSLPETRAYINALKTNAKLGDPEAPFKLGHEYMRGHRVKENRALAEAWYNKAADNGNADAQANIGYSYYHGRSGFTKNAEKAIELIKKSAESGNPRGQKGLGNIYASGHGNLEKDLVKAYMWYKLSGYSFKSLQDKMTPKQIEEGEHLASIWSPKVPTQPTYTDQLVNVPPPPKHVSLSLLPEEECKGFLDDKEYARIFKGKDDNDQREIQTIGTLCGRAGDYCKAADRCGDVVGIDCNSAGDGPYYFIDLRTKKTLAGCAWGQGGCKLPTEWRCDHTKNYRG